MPRKRNENVLYTGIRLSVKTRDRLEKLKELKLKEDGHVTIESYDDVVARLIPV